MINLWFWLHVVVDPSGNQPLLQPIKPLEYHGLLLFDLGQLRDALQLVVLLEELVTQLRLQAFDHKEHLSLGVISRGTLLGVDPWLLVLHGPFTGDHHVQLLLVELLWKPTDREESILDNHVQHVFVHDHVVVRLNPREGVCHNGDQQVDQDNLQEESRQHEEESADLVEVVPVNVGVEITQGDFVHVSDGICH